MLDGLTVLCVVAVLLVGVVACWLACDRGWVSSRRWPGPWGYPVLGVLPKIYLSENATKVFEEWSMQYGDVFGCRLGRQRAVVLGCPHLIREAFVRNADSFVDRPVHLRRVNKTHNNTGLIWHNGEAYLALRRFSLTVLKDLGVGSLSMQQRIQARIPGLIDHIRASEGAPFSPRRVLQDMVTDVLSSVIFGRRLDEDDDYDFSRNILEAATAPKDVSLYIWNYISIPKLFESFVCAEASCCADGVRRYIRAEIARHRVTYDRNLTRDFIDLYIKLDEEESVHTESISEENLARAILDLYSAGVQPITTLLLTAIFYMTQYPGVQDACRHEIHKHVETERLPGTADLTKLVYTQACLLEAQRLCHAVPLSLPRLTQRDVTLCGRRLRKGSLVFANLRHCHTQSRFWENPDTFDPERWIDSSGNLMRNDAFLPFSVGRRACIGESLTKTILSLCLPALISKFAFIKRKIPSRRSRAAGEFSPDFLVQAHPVFTINMPHR